MMRRLRNAPGRRCESVDGSLTFKFPLASEGCALWFERTAERGTVKIDAQSQLASICGVITLILVLQRQKLWKLDAARLMNCDRSTSVTHCFHISLQYVD